MMEAWEEGIIYWFEDIYVLSKIIFLVPTEVCLMPTIYSND